MHIPQDILAWNLFVMALATVVSAVVMGKISDIIGRRPVVLFIYFLYTIFVILLFVVYHFNLQYYLSYVMLFIFGFSDSSMNTQVYASMFALRE